MKRKIEKSEEMGGTQSADLKIRITDDLKTGLAEASQLGMKLPMSEIVRECVEPFVAFSKNEGRRPHDFTELAEWYLRTTTKKK